MIRQVNYGGLLYIFQHTHDVDSLHDQVVSNNQPLTEELVSEIDS